MWMKHKSILGIVSGDHPVAIASAAHGSISNLWENNNKVLELLELDR